MNHENEYKHMEKTKQYLDKIKTELVMSGYHDGWSVKWLNDKVLELESELKKYKHKFND
jgi:hypothetical protein